MIVEVVHARSGEVRQRLRLETLPFSIGRALDNALVLDDPHVDARHARLVRDEDGSLVIEDLGSLNKLATATHPLAERIRLRAGAEITVGRTLLRFRDDADPVAPAIALHRTAVAGGDAARWHARWHARTPVRLVLIAAALALIGMDAWFGNYARAGATEALTLVIGYGALAVLWAGIWAVAARAVIGQFRFVAHLFITVVSAVAVLGVGSIASWGEFLAPDNVILTPLSAALTLVLLAAVIAWQLANASALSSARRWRAGVTVSAVLVAFAGLFALVDDDAFTDVPEFSAILKAAPMALVPKASVTDFGAAVAEIRTEVDRLRDEGSK